MIMGISTFIGCWYYKHVWDGSNTTRNQFAPPISDNGANQPRIVSSKQAARTLEAEAEYKGAVQCGTEAMCMQFVARRS